MGKFCLYADNQLDAPCAYLQMYKYSYLANFIEDEKHSKGKSSHSVPLLVSCLKKVKSQSAGSLLKMNAVLTVCFVSLDVWATEFFCLTDSIRRSFVMTSHPMSFLN